MSAFSESLRRLRKAQGLTQEQLATTLYVTRQTISNWENDRAQPDYQMLSTVASVLNVPISTLLGEEAPPDVSPLPTESPEPAVLPAQPEFILPECNPLPVLSPDEQSSPDTHPAKKRRLSSPALILAAALLILLPLLSVVFSRPKQETSQFSIDYFTSEALAENASPLLIYTRENSSHYVQSRPEATPYWKVRFFLKETAGTSLYLDLITTVLFFKDGSQVIIAQTAKEFIATIGHPHIAPGEMRMLSFNTPAHPDALGVGLEILARDAQGNPLCFKTYQPLEFTLQ